MNAPPVAVLGEDLWFGGAATEPNPQILNKTIVIGSSNARVIGVMPHGFQFPDIAELWTPLQLDPKFNTRMDHGLEGIARLRPGVTPSKPSRICAPSWHRSAESIPPRSTAKR